jgi:hypothetical protein
MTVIVSASYVLVADISSLYFRTHTNLLLQDEIPEERNDDYDDYDDIAVDTASASHTHVTHVSGMLATCQLKHYHNQFQEFVIRSIPISDCNGQCEWRGIGRVMAGSWHGNGMVCVNPSLKWQGNGMVCVNQP